MMFPPTAVIRCSDELAQKLGWTIYDSPDFDALLYWIERRPHFQITDPNTGAQYLWVEVHEDMRP